MDYLCSAIAQVLADAKIDVRLKDVDPAFLDRGMSTIRRIYQSRVDKGKMSAAAAAAATARLSAANSLADLADAGDKIDGLLKKRATALATAKFGDELRHGVIERQLSAVDEDHDRRGSHRLRDGSQ